MEIKKVPIIEVDVWDKNPRTIKTKDFERLKSQILRLGVYKPLICVREKGKDPKIKYMTLGGNMRLRALRALGMRDIEISIVKAKTEARKIEFALSDNDEAGQTDKQKLAELVYPNIDEIDMDIFSVTATESKTIKEILEEFGPDLEQKPEVEFSEEILLEHNYVILYFDNPFDWEVAKEKFKLKAVKDLIPRKDQPVGIGRVIKGKEWLEKIHD